MCRWEGNTLVCFEGPSLRTPTRWGKVVHWVRKKLPRWLGGYRKIRFDKVLFPIAHLRFPELNISDLAKVQPLDKVWTGIFVEDTEDDKEQSEHAG